MCHKRRCRIDACVDKTWRVYIYNSCRPRDVSSRVFVDTIGIFLMRNRAEPAVFMMTKPGVLTENLAHLQLSFGRQKTDILIMILPFFIHETSRGIST